MPNSALKPRPVEELIERIQEYNPKSDADLIRKAYDFGMAAHEGQFRRSGEPYFCHPVEVAFLLTEIRIDDASIITALLHDTIEDTGVTYEDVEREFSTEIADFVNGVTKLTNLELDNTKSAEVENLRKLLLAISKDVRVLLVKLADRLHNMRTIKAMSPEKQRKKALETIEIYAPLAGRMGMQFLRDELEDLSFQVLQPMARASIMRKFLTLRGDVDNVLETIIGDIEKALNVQNINARVHGREKRPYSIWKKIRAKGEGFERLSDIYAFRIITNSVEDCYRALGAMHQRYTAIPGRFKDYISQPKSNGYRSIHTTVLGRDGKRVEIQIRTQKMHIVAESGVAAHWAYKDGERVQNPYKVDPSGWLADLSAGLAEVDDEEDFMEHFRLEMYADQVFVFSPKGQVVRLPRGATPLDFAYAIHTDLGNKAVGVMVNNERATLSTPLRNGQTVEIIQAAAATPEEAWIEIAKTARAKSAIRRALKQKVHETHLDYGKEIARLAFDNVDRKMTNKALEEAAKLLELKSVDALLDGLSHGDILGNDIIKALYPELQIEVPKANLPVIMPPLLGKKRLKSAKPCPHCLPIPGDRIMGLKHDGKVIYHVVDCEKVSVGDNDENYEWLDLHWPQNLQGASYEVKILVVMANSAGSLGRACTIIGENHSNIEQLDFIERRSDFYSCMFEILVRDVAHLQNILTALYTENGISRAERYRDNEE